MNKVFYPARLHGCAVAPASKSEAHRRIICAGLSGKETMLTGFASSADMKATLKCIKALGAQVSLEGDRLSLQAGERKGFMLPLMDCGESGSTLRFFVPIAMALTGGGVFRMRGRLGQRRPRLRSGPLPDYQLPLLPRRLHPVGQAGLHPRSPAELYRLQSRHCTGKPHGSHHQLLLSGTPVLPVRRRVWTHQGRR